MSPDKLAYMANQIGKFFAHRPHEKAVAEIADHIRKFWDPRMRRAILDALAAESPAGGGPKLDPTVREAILSLRSP